MLIISLIPGTCSPPAIVGVARGKAVLSEPKSEATLYFMIATGAVLLLHLWRHIPVLGLRGKNPYTEQLRYLAAVAKLATEENNIPMCRCCILKCVVGGYLTEKYGNISAKPTWAEKVICFPSSIRRKKYTSRRLPADQAVSFVGCRQRRAASNHDVLFREPGQMDKTSILKVQAHGTFL